MEKTQNAVIYARVSVAEDESGSPSIARQLDLLRDLAQREGYTLAGEYIDDGFSAFTGIERPAWQQLQAAVEAGGVDLVLAVAQDRLNRDTLSLLTFSALCKAHGTRWHVLERGLVDPSEDQLLTTMLAAVAEQESRAKALRLTRANAHRAAAGMPYKSARRPFGYAADFVTAHPEEGPLVTKAFADFTDPEQRVTMRQIADGWSAAGFTTTLGKVHSGASVCKILRNARYAGLRTYRGEIVPEVEGRWVALTTPERWADALARLDGNRRATRREYVAKSLLSGIARCACGEQMSTGYKSNGIRIYRCKVTNVAGNGTNPDASHEVGHVSINANDLDAYVSQIVATEFLGTEQVDAALSGETNAATIATLRAEQDDVQSRVQRLVDIVAEGILTSADVSKRRSALEAESSALMTRVGELVADDAERSWVARARAAVAAGADGPEAMCAEFEALPIDDRRGIIGGMFTVQVLRRSPGTGRGAARRCLVFLNIEPKT